MRPVPPRRSLRTRLFLAHLLVLTVVVITLFTLSLLIGPGVHDRLMYSMLHPSDGTMIGSVEEMTHATTVAFVGAMVQSLLISTGAAALAAVAVSLFLATRIITPIQRLLAASHRIAAGHYVERVIVENDDELGALAAEFNTMAAELEAAERRRVALIGDVAHELRTPLATIEGYTEGLLDGVVAPEPATWAILHDEASRLRRLVQDLQDLSRAEAHQIPLHPQPTAPHTFVQHALARIAPQFAEKQISLINQVPADLPLVQADQDRVIQVLMNLLGNALRYTPPGGTVTLTVTQIPTLLVFHVTDTGIGLPAEALPHLFERFYRVDKARSRALGGSGIGLTIARALIEMHGGQIWASSPGPGLGATFTFTLPLASA